MVDVFGVGAGFFEPGGIVFCAIFDFVEGGEGLLYFGGGEDADGFKVFGSSAVDSNFVGEQAAIEREGALERVEARVWFAIEAAAPEAIVFAVSHGGSRQSSVVSFGKDMFCQDAAVEVLRQPSSGSLRMKRRW